MTSDLFSAQNLTLLLERLQPDQGAPGAVVAVSCQGQLSSAALGLAAPDGRGMTVHTPLRLASVSKTLVAASMLRLWELGQIDLDVPLADEISENHAVMLQNAGYDLDAIKIRHVLMHASGLRDHFGSPDFTQTVLANPARIWSRSDQIDWMVRQGAPLAEPGAEFHYSDTGYVLLGEVLERKTARPLAEALRDLLGWTRLGLTGMHWEGEALSQSEARAHQWIGDLDTTGIHGSVDAFGGGGLITTMPEAARFFAALFAGQVFDREASLDLMLNAPGAPEGSPYRLGLFRRVIKDVAAYHHGGFWGIEMLAIRDRDLVIVAAVLDQERAEQVWGFVDALAQMVLET